MVGLFREPYKRTGSTKQNKGKKGAVGLLTRMILGFVMQQNNIQAAISNAVFLHGKVADTSYHSCYRIPPLSSK